jgi:Amt family ammonium transporter
VIKKSLKIGIIALWLLSVPLTDNALAQDAAGTAAAVVPNPIDTGDTAWMLVSSALVLLMTPGLAFFYGGLVRSRNVLNTMMMSLVMMGVIGVTWTLWGYSLAFDVTASNLDAKGFGQGIESFIGGFDWHPILGKIAQVRSLKKQVRQWIYR